MDNIYFWIICFLLYFGSVYTGYIIGYKNGFNESKKIDDKIIEETIEKYKGKNNEY